MTRCSKGMFPSNTFTFYAAYNCCYNAWYADPNLITHKACRAPRGRIRCKQTLLLDSSLSQSKTCFTS